MSARILIIEDHPANLELMHYLLDVFGYSLTTATDGQTGFAIATSQEFALIICDVNLPLLDGFEIARQLKASPLRRDVPIITVTAIAMVGDRERILKSGFDGYLTKPIDPELFIQYIESFLPTHLRRSNPTGVETVENIQHESQVQFNVLVVDNLEVNLDLTRVILEPHGFRVVTASGINEALALARIETFQLIISDVCMSGESGYDFIRAVKADPKLCLIPFVFLTSTMTNEKDRLNGLFLGAVRYLFRPIEPNLFLSEIRECLNHAGKVS